MLTLELSVAERIEWRKAKITNQIRKKRKKEKKKEKWPNKSKSK